MPPRTVAGSASAPTVSSCGSLASVKGTRLCEVLLRVSGSFVAVDQPGVLLRWVEACPQLDVRHRYRRWCSGQRGHERERRRHDGTHRQRADHDRASTGPVKSPVHRLPPSSWWVSGRSPPDAARHSVTSRASARNPPWAKPSRALRCLPMSWLGGRRGRRPRGRDPGCRLERRAEGGLRLLDQTLLPGEEAFVTCVTVDAVVDAIERLVVRGAPALGAAGAFGVAVALAQAQAGRLVPGGAARAGGAHQGSAAHGGEPGTGGRSGRAADRPGPRCGGG